MIQSSNKLHIAAYVSFLCCRYLNIIEFQSVSTSRNYGIIVILLELYTHIRYISTAACRCLCQFYYSIKPKRLSSERTCQVGYLYPINAIDTKGDSITFIMI